MFSIIINNLFSITYILNFIRVNYYFKMNDDKKDIIEITGDTDISPEYLKNISNNLKEGGKIIVRSFYNNDINKLKSSLRICGFTDITIENNNAIAVKKNWSKGKKSDNPWKMIKLEEKVDLILEDELIDPNDKFQKFSKANDCITKPKPCKNCNCGRADKEKALQPDFMPSCGKCYLGDAYRCEGCPYRGIPAFEPGDKIEINGIQSNIEFVQTENNLVKLQDNKIKLDI